MRFGVLSLAVAVWTCIAVSEMQGAGLPVYPGAKVSSQITFSGAEAIAGTPIGKAIKGAEELTLASYKVAGGLDPESVLKFYEKELVDSGLVARDFKPIVRWVQGKDLGVLAAETKQPAGVIVVTADAASEAGTKAGEIVVALVVGRIDLSDLITGLQFGPQAPAIATRSVSAEGIRKVRLETPRGPVWVRSVDGSTLRARVLGMSTEQASKYGIDASTRGSEAVFRVSLPSGESAVPVELVAVPSVEVEVVAKDGAALVQGPFRSVSVQTGDGAVVIRSVESGAAVVVGNGGVDLRDVAGEVRVECGRGMIRGSGLSVGIGKNVLKTGLGNITLDLGTVGDGTLDVSTSNGSIVLRVPRSSSATIKATAVNGRVVMSPPLQAVPGAASGEVAAKLGAGKAEVRLSTSNGTITVEVK
ncbi:MAG: DUF4097 family beta strand repeat-containing protein [Armatimonadota bacterium]